MHEIEKESIIKSSTNVTRGPIKSTNKMIGSFNRRRQSLIAPSIDNRSDLVSESYQSLDSVSMSKDDDWKPTEISGNLSKYFRLETCRYSQIIYNNAAILLRKFKYEPKTKRQTGQDSINKISAPNVHERISEYTEDRNSKSIKPNLKLKLRNFKEKKLTYELALSTLKFESIYEKILEEVGFFVQFPDFRDEEQLVMVILCDYVKRKFQKRTLPREELPEKGGTSDQPASDIESAVYKLRTKLNAAIMRTRVRHSVRNLNQLLPESYREFEEFAETMLVYLWYNSNLASNTDFIEQLTKMGFQRVSAAKNLERMEFYQDRHCSDVYVFHHEDREILQDSEMVNKKRIAVVQDKSTCLAIHCFIANIVQGEEIAIVNPTSIMTAIHVEGLLKNKFGSVVPLAPIRVIRMPKSDDDPKLQQKMGSTSIKMHHEDIISTDPTNEKYRNIRHVLFQAKCTRSGVISPIDFLDTENDDITLLKDHAQRAKLNGAKPTKISDCIVRSTTGLKQCFKFPTLRAVTYLTHSIFEEENEGLVNKTMDLVNKVVQKETVQANGRYEIFENVPPNLPMLIDDLTENGILQDKNIMYKPSVETNGFFISIHCKEHRFTAAAETNQESALKKKKKKELNQ